MHARRRGAREVSQLLDELVAAADRLATFSDHHMTREEVRRQYCYRVFNDMPTAGQQAWCVLVPHWTLPSACTEQRSAATASGCSSQVKLRLRAACQVAVLPLLEARMCVAEQRAVVWRTLRAMPLRLLERMLPWVAGVPHFCPLHSCDLAAASRAR